MADTNFTPVQAALAPLFASVAELGAIITDSSELLGQGSFGRVVAGKYEGGDVAVKIIPVREDTRTAQFLCSALREILMLAYCAHPATLGLLGWNFNSNGEFLVVTERLKYQSLNSRTVRYVFTGPRTITPPGSPGQQSRQLELDPTEQMIILYGVASALAYLHSRHVIHCDVKPDNILLDERKYPRITDFALAQIGGSRNREMMVGTPLFMAPETIDRTSQGRSYPADVYAFGITCYEILTGHGWHIKARGAQQLFGLVRNGERPSGLEKEIGQTELSNLVATMWDANPENRPTFSQIIERLENPELWLGGVDAERFRAYVDWLKQEKSPLPPAGVAVCLERLQGSAIARQVSKEGPIATRLANVVGLICSSDPKLATEIAESVREQLTEKGGLVKVEGAVLDGEQLVREISPDSGIDDEAEDAVDPEGEQ